MSLCRYTKFVVACLLLFCVNAAFSGNKLSSEFFASNNTKEINLQTAYDRLISIEQSDLQNRIINIMQKDHIQQGKFEDILGTYRMSIDKNITADNTVRFETSPYQVLSNQRIFSLAKELAVTLKQDSVAVLIPGQSNIGEITVNFIAHQPSIKEIVNLLHDKLPALYNQAFSLYFTSTCDDFNNAKVAKIEWLGSKISLNQIRKAFPLEKINSRHGRVFLVYQNGRKERL